MTVEELDEIRCYMGIAPVIVNVKDDANVNIEQLEKEFDIPFISMDALTFVEDDILPAVNSGTTPMIKNLDRVAHQYNIGVILTDFRLVCCRKATTEFMIHLLQRHFAIIFLTGSAGSMDVPHAGCVFFDQWEGVEEK